VHTIHFTCPDRKFPDPAAFERLGFGRLLGPAAHPDCGYPKMGVGITSREKEEAEG